MRELPLGLPGRVFGSPMPFSAYDADGRALEAFHDHEVAVIVLLAAHEECLANAGRDLPRQYREAGFEVIHLPIEDFAVPTSEALAPAVRRVLADAHAGRNVAIHCHAGRGRTGLFAACLAREALGLSGDEAITWVRRHVPGAVETPAQQRFVRDWEIERAP